MSALSAHPELHFIVAGDPSQRTGGYLYDAHIVTQLRRLGWQLTVNGLVGHFPTVDAQARQAMAAALSQLADDSLVVIDGLALGGLPEVVLPHARRLRLLALVHHPLADEGGFAPAQQRRVEALERQALSAMRGVITTSHFSARRIAQMGLGAARIEVVEPGVEARPLAAADHSPARLLCVASLTPRKGHALLVEALSMVADLDWRCDCIGSLTRDAEHAARMHAAITAHGLGERMRLQGELDDSALHAAYANADLFVLPSHYEGYGMVVTEAVAAGLPVLCTTGGALRDTLPPEAGIAVPAGDVAALAAALRNLLSHPEARLALRDGARRARTQLTDWKQAGSGFAAALERLSKY